MTVHSPIGTTFWIGPETAATTEAAYEALTWTKVVNLESFPEFGPEAEIGKFKSVSEALEQYYLSHETLPPLALMFAHDPLDPGQIAMLAARTGRKKVAMKVIVPDGADANDTDSVMYFHGLVPAFKLEPGSGNKPQMRKANVQPATMPIFVVSEVVA